MLFITPYILTFLSFVSYSYLLGTYSFIHKNLIELFQITKTQLGIINGILGFGSTFGVILFLMYSTHIKPKIVTSYTWGCIGYMLPYALIVLASIISATPSKIFLYIAVILIGIFRSIFFPSLLIMIKIHKEIYDRTQSINQHNYKLLTNIWSVSFDVGMVFGFFGCNWLQYTINMRWQYLVIIGLLFMLTTTTLLFLGLRSYMEDDQQDNSLMGNQIQQNQSNQPQLHETSFSSFFSLINSYLPSKWFLVNSTIIDALHLGFVFVLPAFFYESGYKGNEGYLVAIYSLFIVFGAWLLAISDFVLHKISEKVEKKQKQNLAIESEDEKGKDKAVFLFIFSISLLFFALTLIILTVLSFQSSSKKGTEEGESYLHIQMILMCSLGFFFGGPLKSYFSYRTIKAMGGLQKVYQKQMQTNQQFYEKQTKIQSSQNLDKGCLQRIGSHKLQIGSSLITTNRILTHFTTVIMFIIAFWLLQKYISYAMGFLALLGVLGFVFDIVQNIIAVRYEEKEQKQKAMERLSRGKDI